MELFSSHFAWNITNTAFRNANYHFLHHYIHVCLCIELEQKSNTDFWLQDREKNCPKGQHAEKMETSSSLMGCLFLIILSFLYLFVKFHFPIFILEDFLYFFISLII